MLKAARVFKPDRIVHMGDLADFYALSFYDKDPERAYKLKEELKISNSLLDDLDALGAKEKDFIEGNHCDRLARYLRSKAPELADLVSVEKVLKLNERGWRFTKYKDHIRIGKLYLTHDAGTSGKYATSRAMDAFQSSVVIGHHHSMSYLVEGDALGNHAVAAQFGWLGDAEAADYMKRFQIMRKWSLGFGLGYHRKDTGVVFLTPVPIVDYACCVEGNLIKG